MKNYFIVTALFSVAIIIVSVVNYIQTSQIDKLQKQVRCLEQGRIYEGFTFCADFEPRIEFKIGTTTKKFL